MCSNTHSVFCLALPGGVRRLVAKAFVVVALPSVLWAQTAPTTPTTKESATVLPKFEIRESPGNPYQSEKALSTSRVAIPIQDIAQTVSVVTGEFIEDSQAERMLDAAKYVTPVTESTLPMGGDRYNLRGFQISAQFEDGLVIASADGYSMALAPYNIERLEIVKGPNAILIPGGGSPGGVINAITKSPRFKNEGTFNVTAAEFLGSNVNLDVDRVFGDRNQVAGRAVAAYWKSDGYTDFKFRAGHLFAPSLSWLVGARSKLTVKGFFLVNREANLNGLPLDPSVGSDDNARLLPGLPRNYNWNSDQGLRRRVEERLSAELQTQLSRTISSRLFVMANHAIRDDNGGLGALFAPSSGPLGSSGTNNLGGAWHPLTGKWVPGFTYSINKEGVVTSRAVDAPGPILTRGSLTNYLEFDEFHFKNDYIFAWNRDDLNSTTSAGFGGNYSQFRWKSVGQTSSSIDLTNLAARTDPPFIINTVRIDKKGWMKDGQVYAHERLTLFRKRLILVASLSRYYGRLTRTDSTKYPVITAPTVTGRSTDGSYGLIFKPVPALSFFYGLNHTGGALPATIQAGSVAQNFLVQVGSQQELGVKLAMFDNRLTASLVRFDIAQSNVPYPNPDLFLNPKAPPLLYTDLISKGWEFEASYALGKRFTLMGNAMVMEAHDPLGITPRGTPKRAGAVYVDYRFTTGALSGFGVNFGADFKGRAPGDTPNGFTIAKDVGIFVPNQPTFWVASRTIANLGLSYRQGPWVVRLTIKNLFDKEYIQAAGSRTVLFVGDPRNFTASCSYKF